MHTSVLAYSASVFCGHLLQGDPFGDINLDAQVDGSGVEFMTQEEADKLLSSR